MLKIIKINRDQLFDSHVTGTGFETVGSVAQRLPEYNLIINADGWYKNKSASIWYSEGTAKNTIQMHSRPWINFEEDNDYSFGWRAKTFYRNFNCVSGTRFIVEGGKINSRMSDSGELNARTSIGITGDGGLVIMVVDGRDHPLPQRGLSLTQVAEYMIDEDCVTAVDLDGGGSTTMAINGKVVNNPNDDGEPGQRHVINHLCLKVDPAVLGEVPEPDPEPDPVELEVIPIAAGGLTLRRADNGQAYTNAEGFTFIKDV